MTLLRSVIQYGDLPLRAGRQPFIDRLRIIVQRKKRLGWIDRSRRRGVVRWRSDRLAVAGRQQQQESQAQRFYSIKHALSTP